MLNYEFSDNNLQLRQLFFWGCFTIVTLIFVLALHAYLKGAERLPIFPYLFSIQDRFSACIYLALFICAGALAYMVKAAFQIKFIDHLSRNPRPFLLFIFLILILGAHFIYGEYPLCMDEYAPYFQAQLFTKGHLTTNLPPPIAERIAFQAFIKGSIASGKLYSAYWPGFALLLTPFMLLGVPWLCNPVITVLSLWFVWRVTGQVTRNKNARGWALLFAASSPVVLANGISFYSMNAHMLFSLMFASLMLDRTVKKMFLAGVIGSFALVLHNPLPHTLFALPWIISLFFQKKNLKKQLTLYAGYLPLGMLLGVGWMLMLTGLVQNGPAQQVAGSGLPGTILKWLNSALALPGSYQIWARLAGFAKLILWSSPGLILFAVLGIKQNSGNTGCTLLALSALLTLLAYSFVSYDQGHGWGYRYFHSAFGVLPILAGVYISSEKSGLSTSYFHRVVLSSIILSLLFGTGVRFHQIHTFIDRHLKQLPASPKDKRTVTFVNTRRGYYSVDLVHNNPFLTNQHLIFFSFGKENDLKFINTYFPGARPAGHTDVAALWVLDGKTE